MVASEGAPARDLCSRPNQHAPPLRVEFSPDGANVFGYQNFHLEKGRVLPLPDDGYLADKVALLAPFFRPRFLKDRTVLDLGCNAGFFPLWAAVEGAKEAHGVDIDPNYVSAAHRLAQQFGFENVHIHAANVVDWKRAGDIVVALGLIHWIITCTASIGSLSSAIGWLRSLTRYLLLIEWVEPDDDAIRFFGHLSWAGRKPADTYDRSTFERTLRLHFRRVHPLGQLRPTRFLYAAYTTSHEVDLSAPIPLLHDSATLVSSRPLAEVAGTTFWSRVYALPDRIVKQTTGALAQNEFKILKLLDGPHFPRAIHSEVKAEQSSVEMERIQGTPLDDLPISATIDPDFARRFADDCMEILLRLHAKNIQHRDIRSENVLVRDGHPVLIDFGWAVAPGLTNLEPAGLGAEGRAPEGTSDVFAMGHLLDTVFGRADPVVRGLAQAMMGTPDARLDDPVALRNLLRTLIEKPGSTEGKLVEVIASLRRELAKQESAAKAAQGQAELAKQEALRGKASAELELQRTRHHVAAMEQAALWQANLFILNLLHRLAPPGTPGALRLGRLIHRLRRLNRPRRIQ